MLWYLASCYLLLVVCCYPSSGADTTCFTGSFDGSGLPTNTPSIDSLNSGGYNVTLFPSLAFRCTLAISHVRISFAARHMLCKMDLESVNVKFELQFWSAVGSLFAFKGVHTAELSGREVQRQCQRLLDSEMILTLSVPLRRSENLLPIVEPGYVVGLRLPLQLEFKNTPEDEDDEPKLVNVTLAYQQTLKPALFLPVRDVVNDTSSPAPVKSDGAEFIRSSIYLAPQVGFLVDASTCIVPEAKPEEIQSSSWEHIGTFLLGLFSLMGIFINLIFLLCMLRCKLKLCPKVAEEKEGSCYYSYPRALVNRRPPVVISQPEESPSPQPYIFPRTPHGYVNCSPGRRPTTVFKPTTVSTHTNRTSQRNRPINSGNTNDISGTNSTNSSCPTTPDNFESQSDPVYEDTCVVDSPVGGPSEPTEYYLNTTGGNGGTRKSLKFQWLRHQFSSGSRGTDREYI